MSDASKYKINDGKIKRECLLLKLQFVCGAVTEIKEYLIRGGNNETFNNNNRGLILSFADDCDMEPESSLSKCFEIAFEKVLLSTSKNYHDINERN